VFEQEQSPWQQTAVTIADHPGNATLTLVSAGDRKITVIKVVHNATRGGIKEAKAFVDHAPSRIERIDAGYARQLQSALEAAGATTRLELGSARRLPTPEPSAATGASLASELERLTALHASGALSDDEFKQAKAKILGA
jgi:hypothetical protein